MTPRRVADIAPRLPAIDPHLRLANTGLGLSIGALAATIIGILWKSDLGVAIGPLVGAIFGGVAGYHIVLPGDRARP